MTFTDGLPIYVQMAERLCDEIAAGVYGDNERVPSVREYSALLGVNCNTTVKAYDLLVQRELIYNRRGMGFYVAVGAAKKIVSWRRSEFMEQTLPDIARRMHALGVTPADVEQAYRQCAKGQSNP